MFRPYKTEPHVTEIPVTEELSTNPWGMICKLLAHLSPILIYGHIPIQTVLS